MLPKVLLRTDQTLLELAQVRIFRGAQFTQADRRPVVDLPDIRAPAQQIQNMHVTQLGLRQPVRRQFPIGLVSLVTLDIDIEPIQGLAKVHRETEGNLVRIVRMQHGLTGVCRAGPDGLFQRHGLPVARMSRGAALA
ncbi:hypothetical protein D3C85_1005220 [compost metagenome]